MKRLLKIMLGPALVLMLIVAGVLMLTGKQVAEVYDLTNPDSRRQLSYSYPTLFEGVEKAIERGEIPNDMSGDVALVIETDWDKD